MKTTFLRAILPMALVFTMMSCSSDSTEDLTVPTGAIVQKYDYRADEVELADLINDHRASLGLNPLQTINHISYKAEEHNEYMIAKKELNHDLFAARSQNIIQLLGAVKVNENVAYNYSSPEAVLNAWLHSPGHKANIEGNFTHFGISIREDAVTGKKYYTNIFMKK